MPRTQHPTRPPRRSKRRTWEQKFLEQVHLNAAGIDIGSGSHWVAVPPDRDEQPVREFRSFTHALIDLADWLTAVTSTPSRWSRPACTGSRSMKCWRHEASRCSSSMPGTSRTCPDAKAMCPTASGSSGFIPLAYCAAASGPPRRSPPSGPCCATETPSWRGRPPVSNGCRRR